MNADILPQELARWGPLVVTDTALTSLVISVLLVLAAWIAMRIRRARELLEIAYESLERSILESVQVDARPLVPLILTQWIFILTANLASLVPRVAAPTRDLSVTVALALIAFFAGHVYGFRAQGVRYLRQYIEPTAFLLPLHVIGELSRTLALALRLFGNMMSGHLIAAVLLYLVGLLLPIPLLMLGVLTSVVQAYIFGILTLVFTASSMQVAERARERAEPQPSDDTERA